jgi:hypothetical protein
MSPGRAPGRIDRDPQNLPVPLGGGTPVRVQRSRRHREMRSRARALVIGVAITCAAVGVALLALPPSIAVYLLGDRLTVGNMVLRAVGPLSGGGTEATLYDGDASYVLTEPGNGSARAAATWTSSGAIWSGVCNLHAVKARLIDECTFTVSTGRLTSVDVLDPAGGSDWQRTYDDGVRATIAVLPDGAAVPVPFPIGH